jgi:hypothetical protein
VHRRGAKRQRSPIVAPRMFGLASDGKTRNLYTSRDKEGAVLQEIAA